MTGAALYGAANYGYGYQGPYGYGTTGLYSYAPGSYGGGYQSPIVYGEPPGLYPEYVGYGQYNRQ